MTRATTNPPAADWPCVYCGDVVESTLDPFPTCRGAECSARLRRFRTLTDMGVSAYIDEWRKDNSPPLLDDDGNPRTTYGGETLPNVAKSTIPSGDDLPLMVAYRDGRKVASVKPTMEMREISKLLATLAPNGKLAPVPRAKKARKRQPKSTTSTTTAASPPAVSSAPVSVTADAVKRARLKRDRDLAAAELELAETVAGARAARVPMVDIARALDMSRQAAYLWIERHTAD